MILFYDQLRPRKFAEWVSLLGVLGSAFSGVALFSLQAGGRDVSLEPHIISLAIAAVLFVLLYHWHLIVEAWRLPWRWLSLWFALGFAVALWRTDSPATTLLFAAYSGALYAVLLGFSYGLRHKQIRLDWLLRVILSASVGLAVVGLVQFVVASLSDIPILRLPYQVGIFSFPRIHGFSYEPLFYANWLLPAFFYFLFKERSYGYSMLLAVVLFLSLARGALYAIVLVLLVYIIVERKTWLQLIKYFSSIMIPALVVSLVMIGGASAFNGSTFADGVGRYLDHASLGIFNYSGSSNVKPKIVYIDGERYEIYSNSSDKDYEGVVEASTYGRLEFLRLGKKIIDENPRNLVIGVGMHRFGQEAHELAPGIYSDEQVSNNQYMEILTETGIIGLGLWLLFFCSAAGRPIRLKYQWLRWTLLAMLVQYLFFSNYLLLMPWLAAIALMASSPSKEKT